MKCVMGAAEISDSRIFVTDGSYPNGLAAVRALGRAGYAVASGERSGTPLPATVSFWSRHCTQRVLYPDPAMDERATSRMLAELFERQSFGGAIPVGLDMVELFVRHASEFRVPLMLPPADGFAIAADKRRTFEYAASAGIRVPRTVAAERWEEIAVPVVFKEARKGAYVASNREKADAFFRSLGERRHLYLAQEYVPGTNGFGYFGFFREGREAGYFMHERLVQFPREGGPSVVARSIRDERLRALGKRLLEALRWNGVAMVEFKRSDADGEFYLMEINPKLWGSLDLAIASGCNFPVWIADALTGRRTQPFAGYAEGVTYQWIVPHGVKSFVRYPEFRGQFVRNVVRGDVRTDMRWSDPLPTAAGLLAMAAKAIR